MTRPNEADVRAVMAASRDRLLAIANTARAAIPQSALEPKDKK